MRETEVNILKRERCRKREREKVKNVEI